MATQKNIGEQIRDAVQDAINSQDFSKLNETVSKTIGTAVDNIGRNLQAAADKKRQEQPQVPPFWQNKDNAQVENQTRQQNEYYYGHPSGSNGGRKTFNEQWVNEPYQRRGRAETPTMTSYRYSSVNGARSFGYFMAISGGILTLSLGLGTLSTAIVALFTGGMGVLIGVATMSVLLAGSIVLLVAGVKQVNRIKLFQQFVRILGNRSYCDIKELANKTGRSPAFVVSSIKKMLTKGMFRQGYLDQKETCLMVTDEVYHQYQVTEKQREEQVHTEQIIQTQKSGKTKEEQRTAEVQAVLDEGNAYIQRIHRSNDAIPGEEISAKISRMELIVKRIFQRAEEHSEILPDLKRLMEYYLPTTVKLLDAYEELDKQPIQGENILTSKKEIETTLDTLNVAFEKLLDSIFKDVAWDVSTDISVLHTILAQEGLTEDAFNVKEKSL